MVVEICPICNSRYTRMEHNTSFEHNCNIPEAIPTIRKEDKLNIQISYENPDGTSGTNAGGAIFYKGVQNKLFGTDAALMGEDVETVNTRGKSINTYRSRTRFTYIDKSDC